MRLVKAVSRKSLHQVEDFVGFGLDNAVFSRTVGKYLAMLRHLFGLFLAHGAAQQIGATQRIAAQNLGRLHDLLLVDHDAVGFAQHRLDQWVGIGHLFAPMLARHKTGDQVHGAGPVQSVQGDQVFQPGGACVAQHALHAPAFKLEHSLGFAV